MNHTTSVLEKQPAASMWDLTREVVTVETVTVTASSRDEAEKMASRDANPRRRRSKVSAWTAAERC